MGGLPDHHTFGCLTVVGHPPFGTQAHASFRVLTDGPRRLRYNRCSQASPSEAKVASVLSGRSKLAFDTTNLLPVCPVLMLRFAITNDAQLAPPGLLANQL